MTLNYLKNTLELLQDLIWYNLFYDETDDCIGDIRNLLKKCLYKGGRIMTRETLISLVPNKPYRMPCCRECMGKAKKDCDENPLNCFDFYLLNKETIDKIAAGEIK